MKNKNDSKNSDISPFKKDKIKINIEKLQEILPEACNHGICGSKNLGYTCYMNSSIACLSNCTELTTFFLSKQFKEHINSSNKMGFNGKLAKEWYELLKEYWKTDKERGNPYKIQSLMAQKYKKFGSVEQQDANEFIVLFLELLSEDLNEIKTKKYYELTEQQKNETDTQCAARFWKLHKERNNSIITDLFYGLNKSIITCTNCQYKSITYNPFSSLSLLIPNSRQLPKLKYLNFSKDDIFLFYIPKLSLSKAYKIFMRIDKNITFKSIINQINEKIDDFPFEIKNYDIISVVNKKLYKKRKSDEIFDNSNPDTNKFIFVIEKDSYEDKQMCLIPLYISIGDNYLSYPRGLYVYSGMPYRELKKKIYCIVRKIFYNFNGDKRNSNDEMIKDFYFYYNKEKEEKVIQVIKKEYDNLLKENKKFCFPYNILIQQNIDSNDSDIIFDGINDNFDYLREFNINSKEDIIDSLAKNLQSSKNVLIVNIDNKSEYYRKSIVKEIDNCIILQSKDYCNRDFIKDININLEDCLQFYNTEERLEDGNEWFCKKCKKQVKALKKSEFFYLPNIMILCLSRFKKISNDYIKNEQFINYPLTNLKMNKFMTMKNEEDYIYDIFGVVEHYGGREGGHYTAICQNYDGNWYSYDDSNCSSSHPKEVHSKNAYILFYRRRDL